MYQVAIRRSLVSFHQLIGGDWGKENEHHSHDYLVEVVLKGKKLDRHGYLFDIAVLKERVDEVCTRYEKKTLNELPEFHGLNPSLERFAQFFAEQLHAKLELKGLSSLKLTLWEDPTAWATFRISL
jgi:6-pyruvoyltetrahydropterin/6-carboxytetrahydropterin synthase